jgi:aldose sugar dehydrogenase
LGVVPQGTAPLVTESPVHHWTPAVAPSGLTFYEGDQFPEWKGNLFLGSLAQKHIRRLELDRNEVTHEEVLLQELQERIRDVRVSPDGYPYVVTDDLNGRIVRLEPAPNDDGECSRSALPERVTGLASPD